MYEGTFLTPLATSDYQALRKEYSKEADDYLRYMLAKGFNSDKKTDLSKTA
jgi:hypothetical protein